MKAISIFLGMAICYATCAYVSGQDTGQNSGSLTNWLRVSDDEVIRKAVEGLEDIRSVVITTRVNDVLWASGTKGFPHLQVLADRWSDLRSEQILRQLTNSGPVWIEGELEMQTLAFAAARYLILLQDNREYDHLLKGVDKPEDRVKKIREYFDAHPDLMATQCYGKPNRPIVRMFLDEAEKLQGAGVIDLLVRSQLYGTDHFKPYGDALWEYASKIGPKKVLETPYLVQYIIASGNTNVAPLIASCLAIETRERNAESLAMQLARFSGSEKLLLQNINHVCPKVVRFIARHLSNRYPQDAEAALTSLLNRRRQEAAGNTELSDIERELAQIRKLLRNNEVPQ